MKYTIDTEFIDTPGCSALISLAVVCEDGREIYFEFDYPADQVTPWLQRHVVPHVTGERIPVEKAASAVRAFVGNDRNPQFWCHYGAYDWYWFCRLFGGFMQMPPHWPHRFEEFAVVQQQVMAVAGPEHHALNDAKSLMQALKKRKGMSS